MAKLAGSFTPFLFVSIGIVTLAVLLVHNCQPATVDRPDFQPLELRELRITPEAFRAGESVTLHDGLCNKSDEIVTAQLYLTLIQESAAFMAPPLYLVPQDPDPSDAIIPPRHRQPIKPDECLADAPLVSPAPQWPPGVYHLFLDVLVFGNAGEEQRIEALSNSFRVLGAQETGE